MTFVGADDVTQAEINEAEWSDPANWRWGGVYFSERDTRVWVAKPIKWTGWTLNFAHRASYLWLLGLVSPGILVAIAAIIVSASR